MTALERILDLTHHVEEHVASGRWHEAAAVEAERRTLLEAYVADDLARGPGGRKLEALREVLARDARTLERVHAHRAALLSDFKRLSDGSRVAAAYANSARRPSR